MYGTFEPTCGLNLCQMWVPIYAKMEPFDLDDDKRLIKKCWQENQPITNKFLHLVIQSDLFGMVK